MQTYQLSDEEKKIPKYLNLNDGFLAFSITDIDR